MSILFVGGEDLDFVATGNAVMRADADTYRAALSRGAMRLGPAGTLSGALSVASARIGLSARALLATGGETGLGGPVAAVYADGALVFRVAIDADGAVTLEKTAGTVAQRGLNPPLGHLLRFDILADLGPSGSITVWINGVLALHDAGGTASPLADSFALFHPANTGNSYWSEVAVLDADPRTVSVFTLAPASLASSQWTGNVSAISEVVLDASHTLSAGANAQVAAVTFTPPPTGLPFSLKVSAAMVRDGAAPDMLAFGLNQPGLQSQDAPTPLGEIYATETRLFPINPITNAAWTASDIASLQVTFNAVSSADKYLTDENGFVLEDDEGKVLIVT